MINCSLKKNMDGLNMEPEDEQLIEAGFATNPVGLTGTGVYWDMKDPSWTEAQLAPRAGMIAEREIWITFQKEGVHKYPAALDDPRLADVSFLGHPHRHIFHFRVAVTVTHNDRDIEFILFKRELENLYSDGIMQMDYKSCEMLAEELIGYIGKNYPNRKIVVSVSEDNENGATLTWLP